MKRILLVAAIALAALTTVPTAQMRVMPIDEEHGHVALGLALRHLANTGVFLHTTAHPDDENNPLLVMLNRGQGYRTALATATRGNGGQNEIGPEIFEPLGVLRTEELASLHRFDGAEQYFTRAVDFGYSFGIDETYEKWGRQEITADYVRLLRTIRPDVVIALPETGNAGGQHHMASANITRDAVKLAGDPTKFPEQIQEGLKPWQPKKFYFSAGFGFPGEPQQPGKLTRINTAVYDQLLGKTYAEIGAEERSMHKCQGMGQLLALPGPAAASYRLAETYIPEQPDEQSLFAGIDSSIGSLARFAGATPPQELVDGLKGLTADVQAAQKAFETEGDAATIAPLAAGLHRVRGLMAAVKGMSSIDELGRYDIDFRLRQKEKEFQQALIEANGIRLEALADDGIVVPGQPVSVDVIVANRGAADVNVKKVVFGGFEGEAACEMRPVTNSGFGFPGSRQRNTAAPTGPVVNLVKKDMAVHCEPTVKIPSNARTTEPYWHRKGYEGRYTFDADAPFGLPYRPNPFSTQLTFTVGTSDELVLTLPVVHRYEGNIFSGEKRGEVLVVPDFSVRTSPEFAIIPADSIRTTGVAATATGRTVQPAARASERELRVTVMNDTTGPADTTVSLELPKGWTATPATQTVNFTRSDESLTVRFTLRPAVNTAPGEYPVKAIVTSSGRNYGRGFQVIEYPHIGRRHFYYESKTTVKVIDVKTAPGLVVGYVMGVGDEVPAAIEQLGAKVEMISPDQLAWGNLSKYHVIMTGVRAYERRDDLRANNARLLEYVKNGGTMIVQYNKFEFNDAQYGPYPAKVSSNRVTDETSPVKVLEPENHVFTQPNRINTMVWDNWVQERGLYFLGDRDPKYKDLVSLEDNFAYNKGIKTGALVQTTYGKGTWIYSGLNFWRQLPQGTDGAYKLFANLISLGKPVVAPTPAISNSVPR